MARHLDSVLERAAAALGWRGFVILGLLATALWDGGFLASRNVGVYDWYKERYYAEFLLDSLHRWHAIPVAFIALPDAPPPDGAVNLPLEAYPALWRSISYWANPETLAFSPFLVFGFLSGVAFAKLYLALHLAVALAGIGLLAKRIGLGPGWALALYVLIVLNPWLMQHLAVGHAPDIAVCYVPLALGLLLGAGPGPLLAGAVVALVVYEGGFHVFVWTNLAVAVFVLLSAPLRGGRTALRTAAAFWASMLLVAAPRLYAEYAVYGGWRRPVGRGYAGAADVWALLVETPRFSYRLPFPALQHGVAGFDGYVYVGRPFLAVLGVVVIAHLVRRSRAVAAWWTGRRHAGGSSSAAPPVLANVASGRLLALALVFAVLGWDDVWRRVVAVLPPLRSEVYPYRFLFVAVVAASAVLVQELAILTAGRRPWQAGAALVLVAIASGFCARNRYFAGVAASMPDPLPSFDVQKMLDDATRSTFGVDGAGDDVPIRAAATPFGVTIPVDAGVRSVALPWLGGRGLDEFDLVGAAPGPTARDGTPTVVPHAGVREVRLEARRYHRAGLGAIALGGYALLVVTGLRRRGGATEQCVGREEAET